MAFFRRRQRTQIVLDGISGAASRAIYTGAESMPNIEFRFQTEERDQITEVVIEMSLISATSFITSALAAHQAAAPNIQYPRGPIGG
jgi:hypothetical protein